MSGTASETSAGGDLNQSQLQNVVSRRHPAYEERVLHWTFCQETYEGGRKWFIKNVHRYLKEGDKEYYDRVSRAYRFNHTREVVNLLTKYIFKDGVDRNFDSADASIKLFWSRAMLYGGDVNVLMRAASSQSSVTGDAWIATDTTSDGSKKLSKASKDRVYAYIVKPQDMLDFAYDDSGNLEWVMYRIPHRNDSDPFTSTGDVIRRYMIWTKTRFYVLEETFVEENPITQPTVVTSAAVSSPLPDASSAERAAKITLVSQGDNPIGVVPLVRISHTDVGDVYVKPGLVDDVVYLDRANANYCSNLDAIIQDQTFSQLVMPSDGLAQGESPEESSQSLTEVGTKRIFLYSADASTPPKYISPDASQARIIIEVIQEIVSEIYHSIGLAGEHTKSDSGGGSDGSSGVAKSYDFDRLNAMLCVKSKTLEHVENELVNMVLLWNGKDAINYAANDDAKLVKYPDTYDVRGLPDEFDIAQNLLVIQAPDSVRQQQMQFLSQKLFPRLDPATRKKINADISKWPQSVVQHAQQMLRMTMTGGDVHSQIRDEVVNNPAQQSGQVNQTIQPTGNMPKNQVAPSKRLKGKPTPQASKQGQVEV